MKKSRLLIYGSGEIARFLIGRVRVETVLVVAVADNRCSKTELMGIPVIPEDSILTTDFDFIVIAFGDVDQGYRTLRDRFRIPKEKIAAYNCSYNSPTYERIFSNFQTSIRQEFNHDAVERLFDVVPTRYFPCTMRVSGEVDNIVEKDYVREQTLVLISEIIKNKSIVGDVAELGVYKGRFSRKINRIFNDRKLYLIDTFSGFPSENLGSDQGLKNPAYESEKFKDTNIERVLRKMPYPEKCCPILADITKEFDWDAGSLAFVSIDLDLYEPSRAALRKCFPLVPKGGYLMIHDYNNDAYPGVKKAIDEFCDERSITCVPIPDFCGSAIIAKI